MEEIYFIILKGVSTQPICRKPARKHTKILKKKGYPLSQLLYNVELDAVQ